MVSFSGNADAELLGHSAASSLMGISAGSCLWSDTKTALLLAAMRKGREKQRFILDSRWGLQNGRPNTRFLSEAALSQRSWPEQGAPALLAWS